ncbi:BlaI/MecI/CopY family transcriptional regulator [Pseudofrankia inefficax]|uniref:Transcriptional repressor, CopY family n=1 Tax=Pseudofrankia inefficax (strain DSM 45817 / CECT 9037 / DDB 130130 / EuI1c) TaxID=298654 RepID=E3JAG2_PSEI1|nr:BlaI/MecI/CopY family transcriptional regulator [Pseudofrankia inefficax]ADP81013.1 transcriptional repressor, CopY family [Pseudofrankia inefficax]
MAGRLHPRPSGGLESEVVACLAAAGEPLTAAQVQAELGADLAYTTVLTTLTRLHAKGALNRSPRGRAYAYELVGSQTEAQAGLTARQMQKLLAAGVDRASVLSRFVDSLDEDSERILRELLARHPATGEEPRGGDQAPS